jgi:hypothetical protein
MIYKKRNKNEKKGHQVFYLSKEHYQQQFYMEPLVNQMKLCLINYNPKHDVLRKNVSGHIMH